MNRRQYLTGAGVIGVGGLCAGVGAVVGGNLSAATRPPRESTQPTTDDDVPSEVEDTRPLAEATHARLSETLSEVRVFIARDGSIAAEYQTDADSADALSTELHQITAEYARLVKSEEFDPATLSVVADGVMAIAPVSSLRAYVSESINLEAFLKTVEVTDVERPNA